MLIHELAQASGFSKDTIRHYEKIGLIELPRHARRSNNYKEYPKEALDTLKAIRNLKQLGFTLEEIREIIIRQQNNALDGATTVRIIEQKILHLNIQIDTLAQYRERLQLARMQMEGAAIGRALPLTEISMRAYGANRASTIPYAMAS